MKWLAEWWPVPLGFWMIASGAPVAGLLVAVGPVAGVLLWHARERIVEGRRG